jgi:hypothetical protein
MAKVPGTTSRGQAPIVEAAQALAQLPHNIGSFLGSASVAQPAVLTPEVARQRLNAEEAAKKAAAAQSAAAPAAPQQTVKDILSAILGGQTGTIPQGYEGFFTHVLGPLMAQQVQSFKMPPLDLTGLQPGDRAAVEKAYGQSAAGLQEMLAGADLSATTMPGLQQFVLGPLANYQKLVQQLQNALSFIPYSAQGIANLPINAQSPLAALGIGAGTSPLAAPGVGPAPALTNPGAVVTASG